MSFRLNGETTLTAMPEIVPLHFQFASGASEQEWIVNAVSLHACVCGGIHYKLPYDKRPSPAYDESPLRQNLRTIRRNPTMTKPSIVVLVGLGQDYRRLCELLQNCTICSRRCYRSRMCCHVL